MCQYLYDNIIMEKEYIGIFTENREIMALIGHGIERKSCARSQECPGYLDFSQEVGCKKQGPRSYQNQSPDMANNHNNDTNAPPGYAFS